MIKELMLNKNMLFVAKKSTVKQNKLYSFNIKVIKIFYV